MQTNFFNHITGLEFQGNLNLTIARAADGQLTVSVLLANASTGKAGKLIPPMILRGEAAELDEGFFNAIGTPVAKTARLFSNMEAYEKSLEAARLQAKSEQEKKNKDKVKSDTPDAGDENAPKKDNLFSVREAEQQEAAQKKKRYDDVMAQIAELNKNCKYAEAISLLPSVGDYPDKAGEIKAKGEALAKRKETYDQLMKDL